MLCSFSQVLGLGGFTLFYRNMGIFTHRSYVEELLFRPDSFISSRVLRVIKAYVASIWIIISLNGLLSFKHVSGVYPTLSL